MNRGKVKNGNRGFTLVEVLIATAILGIMVGPILSSFVSVARVNSTSRKRLSATTAAESVCEAVKAYELKEFAKQCIFPNAGFTLLAGDLEKGTSFSGSATQLASDGSNWFSEATTKCITSDNGKYAFSKSSDRCYYFMIYGIPMGGSTYDAIVTYKINTDKSDLGFINSKGNNQTVQSSLSAYNVRTLNYYDVTISVYKSEGNDVATKLNSYKDKKPLAKMSGTKADYN